MVEDKLEEYAIKDLYHVSLAKMDPSKMNEPVTRRRLYILLIRKTLSCTFGQISFACRNCCQTDMLLTACPVKHKGRLQTNNLP